MPWQSFQPNLPPVVSEVGSAITGGLNAVKTALELVKTEAQLTQALLSVEQGQAALLNSAIQATVNAIVQQLSDLLDNTGVYVLFVPLPKKGFVRIAARADAPGEPGSNFVTFPANAILNQLTAKEAAKLRASSVFQQIFDPDELFLGGNAYFVKTVAESIFDPGDANRPRFQTTDTWAYTCVVAGSSDVTQVLSLATYLDRLFGGAAKNNTNHVAASRNLTSLVPQQIRAGTSTRGTGVVVEWEPVPQQVLLESFDDAVLVPTEWAVIRSTDLRVMTVSKVHDLFPDGDLTAGTKGLHEAVVLHVEKYDGVTSRYFDQSAGSDIADAETRRRTTYYYHVAFRTAVAPSDPRAERIDQGYCKLSACHPFKLANLNQSNPSSPGKFPDWQRTPSLVRLIPPLETFVDQVDEQLKTFAKSAETISSKNAKYIKFLEAEVATFTRKADELSRYITQINNLLSGAEAGLFSTVRSGKGSVGSFLADLTDAFSNPVDPKRPDFDLGDEYVLGVVLLAVGPNTAAVQGALALFTALFGPAATQSPFLEAVRAIGTAAAEADQNAIKAFLGTPTAAAPVTTFDAGMAPTPGVPDASCTTAEPTGTQLDNSFKPTGE